MTIQPVCLAQSPGKSIEEKAVHDVFVSGQSIANHSLHDVVVDKMPGVDKGLGSLTKCRSLSNIETKNVSG